MRIVLNSMLVLLSLFPVLSPASDAEPPRSAAMEPLDTCSALWNSEKQVLELVNKSVEQRAMLIPQPQRVSLCDPYMDNSAYELLAEPLWPQLVSRVATQSIRTLGKELLAEYAAELDAQLSGLPLKGETLNGDFLFRGYAYTGENYLPDDWLQINNSLVHGSALQSAGLSGVQEGGIYIPSDEVYITEEPATHGSSSKAASQQYSDEEREKEPSLFIQVLGAIWSVIQRLLRFILLRN